MQISEYGGEEDEVIDAWNRSFQEDPLSPVSFRIKVLFNPRFERDLSLVAKENHRLLGFVFGQRSGDVGTVDVVFVIPEARRQKVGTALVRELLLRLKAKGVRKVRLGGGIRYFFPGVDVRNEPAIAFFKGLGFSEIDRESVSMGMPIMNYSIPEEVMTKEKELADEGIRVVPLTPALIPALFEFLEKEFPDWKEDARWTLERFPYDLSMFTVAVKGNEVLGYAQFASDGILERFGPFGVSSEMRSKGIGAVIFAHTLMQMKARGARNAWFMWGGGRNTHFYSRYGMKELRRFANMQLAL